LGAGNDKVFVSSDADLDANNVSPAGAAFPFGFLTGNTDKIAGDLNVDVASGRNQLMISDESTTNAKGTTAQPVTVQRVPTGFISGPDTNLEIAIANLNGSG